MAGKSNQVHCPLFAFYGMYEEGVIAFQKQSLLFVLCKAESLRSSSFEDVLRKYPKNAATVVSQS